MKAYFYRLIIVVIIVTLTNELMFQFDLLELTRFVFVMILISFPFALYEWFVSKRDSLQEYKIKKRKEDEL